MKHILLVPARKGQALVVLLMFIVVATMVAVAATLLSSYALSSTTRMEQSQAALSVSESGMENALIRLLRDPSYSGETLTLPDGIATITVTGSTTKTVTSVGKAGNFMRTVVATVVYAANGISTVTSWSDSF